LYTLSLRERAHRASKKSGNFPEFDVLCGVHISISIHHYFHQSGESEIVAKLDQMAATLRGIQMN